MYLTQKTFFNGKPILYGLNTMKAPFGVVMNAVDVQTDINLKRLVTEGSFIASTDNIIRTLPRTRVKTAVLTNSTNITLLPPSFSFKVNDVLYAKSGYAEVIFTGTPTAGDVVSIRVNGVSYTVTAPASPTPASVAAAFVTANAATILTDSDTTVTQRASTGSLLFVSSDSHSIATASSNGAFQALINTTEPGFLGDSIIPLGTIQSIAAPNIAGERVVTLTANAAYALPANTPVGVQENKVIGIYPEPLDFTQVPTEWIAPIIAADGVYENNLPYIDKALKRQFIQLNINKYFYKNV